MFNLPYGFVVPDALFEEELIDLGLTTRSDLRNLGLQVEELNEDGVKQAVFYRQTNPRLSLNDCFAISLAKDNSWPLITGDKRMKAFALTQEIQTYGCLWVIDELIEHNIIDVTRVLSVLKGMLVDETTRIPHAEINKRILSLSGLE